MFARNEALATIRANIERHGYHLYVVTQGVVPRFAYTIGLLPSSGFELVFPGGAYYSAEELRQIIDVVSKAAGRASATLYCVDGLGTFSLTSVDASWSRLLLLGATDYYRSDEVPALQIKPDATHMTIDIPDLSQPWNEQDSGAWKWLAAPWEHPVSAESTATTNLAALRGALITEAVRWDLDEWEMFAGAGPEVPKSDMRVAPVGTLLAADTSLVKALSLAVGEGLWRDPAELEWHEWRRKS